MARRGTERPGPAPKGYRRSGFTLVELLVVIAIIALISVATLPIVLPAFQHRQVSEAARILQAALVQTQAAAMEAREPRGLRLIPDPNFPGPNVNDPNAPLAASRLIQIELPPDYAEGKVSIYAYPNTYGSNGNLSFNPAGMNGLPYPPPTNWPGIAATTTAPYGEPRLVIVESKTNGAIPNAPTSWFWNIRQGDKIQFNGAGHYYTIAGPMQVGVFQGNQLLNPERYVNAGSVTTYPTGPGSANLEFLFLVNGVDDDGDGYVDESFDGIDNDGDGITDPGFNGIDDNGNGTVDEPAELGINNFAEYEQEAFIGPEFSSSTTFVNQSYTIIRRPLPVPGAQEIILPPDVVIDLTTWNSPNVLPSQSNYPSAPERSRVPVDPYTYFVDIMIHPNGQVLQASAGGSAGMLSLSPVMNMPFYHFWLAERDDVRGPLWGSGGQQNANGVTLIYVPGPNPGAGGTPPLLYRLPMPSGSPYYLGGPKGDEFLKGERRLVTLSTRTGDILVNDINNFNGADVNYPYYEAQSGAKGTQ